MSLRMRGGKRMGRFRYRTGVLVGPWRAGRGQAEEDARRAGQARAGAAGGLIWLVPGEIEAEDMREAGAGTTSESHASAPCAGPIQE